jgi:hypothetical protein
MARLTLLPEELLVLIAERTMYIAYVRTRMTCRALHSMFRDRRESTKDLIRLRQKYEALRRALAGQPRDYFQQSSVWDHEWYGHENHFIEPGNVPADVLRAYEMFYPLPEVFRRWITEQKRNDRSVFLSGGPGRGITFYNYEVDAWAEGDILDGDAVGGDCLFTDVTLDRESSWGWRNAVRTADGSLAEFDRTFDDSGIVFICHRGCGVRYQAFALVTKGEMRGTVYSVNDLNERGRYVGHVSRNFTAWIEEWLDRCTAFAASMGHLTFDTSQRAWSYVTEL